MNIKDVLKRPLCEIIDAIEARLSRPRLRIIKTLYVNFRCFPLRNAVKFPILIYGRFNILRLGRIRIEVPRIYHGMIRFGQFTNKTQCPTRIVNSGTIVFSGDCAVWGGYCSNLALVLN